MKRFSIKNAAYIFCAVSIMLLLCSVPDRVQAAEPNEMGEIMIIMYHGLTPYTPKESYMRSVSQFKNDLKLLYENGYRLISVADLLDNNINVEKGYTPVILTFDDGESTAFSLVEKDGELVPRENCAVDIINKFNEEHPDFGRTGVFFICGTKGHVPFIGAGSVKERFSYLVNMGYELGNHTDSHPALSRLNKHEIEKEMAEVERLVRETLPGYRMRCVAYPYGSVPKDKYKEALLSGFKNDIEYEYEIVMREKNVGTSALPYSLSFDKYNVSRVRGSNNSVKDLGWYIKYYKEHEDERFISDGNPDVLTIPSKYADNLNFWNVMNKLIKIVD